MRGTEHLRNARTELLEGDGDDRLRLLHAARAFRAALENYSEWPPSVQAEADSLRARLGLDRTSQGRVGPIAEALSRMDDDTLREVSDDLWRFCEFSAAARRR